MKIDASIHDHLMKWCQTCSLCLVCHWFLRIVLLIRLRYFRLKDNISWGNTLFIRILKANRFLLKYIYLHYKGHQYDVRFSILYYSYNYRKTRTKDNLEIEKYAINDLDSVVSIVRIWTLLIAYYMCNIQIIRLDALEKNGQFFPL